jgi:NCS1 family nucleobase:cation symporter-1
MGFLFLYWRELLLAQPGANIPALLRAGVACGWFGINVFIGGSAINNFIIALVPAWKDFGGRLYVLPG